MTRIVLDTNVLVSALVSPAGAPAAILDRWAAGAFELVTCDEQLAEAAEVLARPKLARYDIDAAAFIAILRRHARVAPDPASDEAFTSDPDDDYLVALAIENACAALVSGDRHLTEMADAPVPILTPRAFAEALADAG